MNIRFKWIVLWLLWVGTAFARIDEPCVLPSSPVHERMANRSFPSVFSAWGGVGWSSVLNLPQLSDLEHMTLHDLYLCCPLFGPRFVGNEGQWQLIGDLGAAQAARDAYVALNPNMLFIVEIRMRDAFTDNLPEDFLYWLTDADGNRVSVGDYSWWHLIDFTDPGMQDIIVQQVIAIAKCGLYDGVFFDWWKERHAVLADNTTGWAEGYRGLEAELRARDNILRRIRAEVRDDFLILVNTNRRTIPRTGTHINGIFMETLRDNEDGYTLKGIKEIETALLWAEENLREPQINSLEGWGIPTESPDSPTNRRWMRVFTTMGLTHSDGYVLYNRGIDHNHYWYNFWDADLGKPIGGKAQMHRAVDGLFIREFSNGWTVYNRSGKAQTISLPALATPVSDRGDNAVSMTHLLPDLDGEIYLRVIIDRNGDGVVNVLDLILVAQSIGTTREDVNRDGITNILDLTLVAQSFSP